MPFPYQPLLLIPAFLLFACGDDAGAADAGGGSIAEDGMPTVYHFGVIGSGSQCTQLNLRSTPDPRALVGVSRGPCVLADDAGVDYQLCATCVGQTSGGLAQTGINVDSMDTYYAVDEDDDVDEQCTNISRASANDCVFGGGEWTAIHDVVPEELDPLPLPDLTPADPVPEYGMHLYRTLNSQPNDDGIELKACFDYYMREGDFEVEYEGMLIPESISAANRVPCPNANACLTCVVAAVPDGRLHALTYYHSESECADFRMQYPDGIQCADGFDLHWW